MILIKPPDGYQGSRKRGQTKADTLGWWGETEATCFLLETTWCAILKHTVDLSWLAIYFNPHSFDMVRSRNTKSERCAVGPHVDSSYGGIYRSSWHPAFSIWFHLNVQLITALRQTKPREEVGHAVTLIPLKIILYSEIKCLHRLWSCCVSPHAHMVKPQQQTSTYKY